MTETTVHPQVTCDCALNGAHRRHRVGASPCQLQTSDLTKRIWLVAIYPERRLVRGSDWKTEHTGRVSIAIRAGFQTEAGAQKRFKPGMAPATVDWADLPVGTDTYVSVIVRNPNLTPEA